MTVSHFAFPHHCSNSKEGHNFYVERNCAMEAKTLRAALTGGFQESKGGVVHLSDISTDVLERVIQYLHYKVRLTCKRVNVGRPTYLIFYGSQIKYNNSRVPPPEFPIEPEMALDLLMASNYLGC